jgi:hypothetical protein
MRAQGGKPMSRMMTGPAKPTAPRGTGAVAYLNSISLPTCDCPSATTR